MRERNAAGRQERRRRRRNGGRSMEARRRKRAIEEWRTFRYRSPPHNRTSVTEGDPRSPRVSSPGGRPGHLAVTSAVQSSLLFSLLSANSLCLSFFLSLISSHFLSSQVNRLRAVIARRTSWSCAFLDMPEKEGERWRGPHSRWSHFPDPRNTFGADRSLSRKAFLSREQHFCVRITVRVIFQSPIPRTCFHWS